MTSSLSAFAGTAAARSACVLALAMIGLLVQAQEGGEKRFTVSAHKYAFNPTRVVVRQDDLVRISFSTEDIPHSFTIDKYRIAKRVEPGKPIVFEFRADQPGRFPIYCNLTADEGCKKMIGELVVEGRK
jgi:heme/copper-type cytochrome/quinol oxidase subunit 2